MKDAMASLGALLLLELLLATAGCIGPSASMQGVCCPASGIPLPVVTASDGTGAYEGCSGLRASSLTYFYSGSGGGAIVIPCETGPSGYVYGRAYYVGKAMIRTERVVSKNSMLLLLEECSAADGEVTSRSWITQDTSRRFFDEYVAEMGLQQLPRLPFGGQEAPSRSR